jgi:hypothetical protein
MKKTPKSTTKSNAEQVKPSVNIPPITDRLSGAEIGRRAGLSRQRVHTLLGRGMSPAEIIETQRLKRTGRAAVDSQRKAGQPESFLSARARKEATLADLRGLELAERAGELMTVGKVQSWFAGVIIAARAHLLRLPAELAEQLGAMDAEECKQLLEVEIHQILRRLVNLDEQSVAGIDEKKPNGRDGAPVGVAPEQAEI